jgi:predicted metal-dependent phosphotriesterase family hydrolase
MTFIHRKAFLRQATAFFLLQPLRNMPELAGPKNIITVTGPMNAPATGFILPHEHLLVDFVGAEKTGVERWDRKKVAAQMLPYLKSAKKAGCAVFFDCTPAYLGRDVILLRQLSRLSGLPIVTNTGYYSAVQHKHLPEHAFTETAEQLAARWIAEYNDGIEDTGIKPGFIKISVNNAPLDDVDQKIVRAAALTHKSTGLTIGSHTGSGKAALEQLDIIAKEGVAANAFVWIHAQSEKDRKLHLEAGKRGAWLEFDNLGWEPETAYVGHIQFMQKAGLLQQMLVSHDAGWYDVEKGGKNEIKPFTPLFIQLVPALQKDGWNKKELHQLFTQNPVAAFQVHKRLLKE